MTRVVGGRGLFAELGALLLLTLYAALKRCSSTVVLVAVDVPHFTGRVKRKVKGKTKGKVKSSGQECPLHTGQSWESLARVVMLPAGMGSPWLRWGQALSVAHDFHFVGVVLRSG
jgi:hypothetical protein